MTVTITPNYLIPNGQGGYSLDPAMFSVGGWTALGVSNLAAYKDPFGHVFCRGSVSNINANQTLLTLPATFRPAITHAFVVETNRQTYASFYVNAGGQLVYSGGPSLGAFDEASLDALHWRAAG